MGSEIDLLKNYPKSKRNLDERSKKTENDQKIAREFGKDFFDGDRRYGYGGFSYNPKFWSKTVIDFKTHWNLDKNSSILDVGCGKGFMIYDLVQLIPNIKMKGIDISEYAIKNSKPEVSNLLKVASADNLPFEDDSFDYVISVNTIHNLSLSDCKKAIKEIVRVSKKGSFITVDAYSNEEEKKRMYEWNLTARTIMSTDEWKKIFKECEYKGDFYWFVP
tara:strand:- start:315 stop:971 length:657 start_codon:yes stop_codon:yes gene_type:complete